MIRETLYIIGIYLVISNPVYYLPYLPYLLILAIIFENIRIRLFTLFNVLKSEKEKIDFIKEELKKDKYQPLYSSPILIDEKYPKYILMKNNDIYEYVRFSNKKINFSELSQDEIFFDNGTIYRKTLKDSKEIEKENLQYLDKIFRKELEDIGIEPPDNFDSIEMIKDIQELMYKINKNKNDKNKKD